MSLTTEDLDSLVGKTIRVSTQVPNDSDAPTIEAVCDFLSYQKAGSFKDGSPVIKLTLTNFQSVTGDDLDKYQAMPKVLLKMHYITSIEEYSG